MGSIADSYPGMSTEYTLDHEACSLFCEPAPFTCQTPNTLTNNTQTPSPSR